ncbi:hypothetical protein IJG04_00235, partial [Candidatus Saccharibacteria bacterium]|nr:hypothetical protein [Candidatus Saccharibacteria bacterium]
ASTFSDSTSTGTAYNGKWGLKPSKYYNTSTNTTVDNTDTTTGLFFPAPTVSGFTIAKTNCANSTSTVTNPDCPNLQDTYTFSLGARADYTQIAGTYTNTYVLQAVGNAITYAITYSDNSGDSSVANLPYFNGNTSNHTQSGSTSTTNIVLKGTGTNNTDDATPTRTGYTFSGWCNTTTTESGTKCNGNTTPTYTAGGNYGIDQTTSNDTTLYALWTPIDYTITINSGTGISTLTATNWTNTGTATISKTYHINDTIDLSTTITPNYKTGYNGTGYTKASGAGSLSSSTFTVGAGNATITIDATGLNEPVCTIQGGATKVYNRTATTLTATDNSDYYDTSSVDITYSFGYASNGTANLGNFTTAQTGFTLSIAANAFRGARYYGVAVVVTDKTNSSITNTCTSGTVDAAVTGTNVDNRTTMTLVNSRINFSPSTADGSLTGTLSGTSPVYVYYKGTATYSSRTGTTARAIPTATPPTGYAFDGWGTSAGVKVINADGTLTGVAVSGWTNESKQWVKTGTSTSASTAANQLYAQYVVSCTPISGYMQDFTGASSYCDSGTLTDRRDNKTYNVAKLADGKWWMTENLAIDLTATSYDDLYGTGANVGKMTNATSQALGYLKGNTTGTSSDQWAMAAVKKTWTSSYSYSQPWIAVDSSTSGLCSDAYCVNSNKSWSSTDVTPATINGTTSIAQGKIGVYYNYCAASAGSYCWGNGTSTTGSPSSDPNTSSLRDIASDICPYGWRLPTGGSSGEFQNLYTQYSSNATNFQTALVTPLSGYFHSGKAYNQGDRGYFWSSTWGGNTTHMWLLTINSSSVSPSNSSNRYFGFSVRCIYDPPTMQSATSSSLATLMPNTGDTAVLVDNRDGQQYRVGKLADGKYWMLENLGLDIVAKKDTLTSSNTNATTEALGYLKNGGGTSSNKWAISGVSKTWTSNLQNYYSRPMIAVDSSTSGLCNNAYCVNSDLSWSSTDVTSATINGVTSIAQGKIGVYYNYCATSAGSYCWGTDNGGTDYTGSPESDPNTSSLRDITSDICPHGWRLPTGGSSGEFQNLYTQYSSNATNFQTALVTPLSGSFASGRASSQGFRGYFWSSTWESTSGMYNLFINSSSVTPSNYNYRYGSYSVRCLLGS